MRPSAGTVRRPPQGVRSVRVGAVIPSRVLRFSRAKRSASNISNSLRGLTLPEEIHSSKTCTATASSPITRLKR